MSSPAPGDDIAALARGGRTNIGGFFLRLAARIPFLIVAGQWYGAEALGRLAYAVLVVEFAAQIATLGLKRGLALHLSGEGKDQGHWDALAIVLLAALLPMLTLIAFPGIMFPNSDINGLEMLLPLIVPALALTEIMLAALAYRFNVGAAVRSRAIVEPWTISIAAAALAWYSTRDGLLIAYGLSIFAAFLTALVPFLRSYGGLRGWSLGLRQLRALAYRNLPLAIADAVEWGSRRLDLAILGLFVSPATVGIYWAAQQVASLPQKFKTSFDPVLGPVITRSLDENDRQGVARQLCQVGFWIIAAQTGIALALGIPAEGVMGLIGSGGSFVGGAGALVFLLAAEVAAAVAVVSEAVLVYIARHRNFMISLAMIGVQAILSVVFILAIRAAGKDELWQAAGPAAALMVALGIASLVKVRLAQHLLGARINVWRWPLVMAAIVAGAVGWIATRGPEWSELALGIPAILGVYSWIVWKRAFGPEDRMLFRKAGVIED